MSHSSRVPFPSIALVLTTEHAHIPHRPSVIKFATAPVPTIKVHPPQDSVEETDLGGAGWSLNGEDPINKCSAHHVASDEEEQMDLAESIYEAPIVEQEQFVVVKFIKEKMSKVLFSFRRLLCVELVQTCFPGVTRQ